MGVFGLKVQWLGVFVTASIVIPLIQCWMSGCQDDLSIKVSQTDMSWRDERRGTWQCKVACSSPLSLPLGSKVISWQLSGRQINIIICVPILRLLDYVITGVSWPGWWPLHTAHLLSPAPPPPGPSHTNVLLSACFMSWAPLSQLWFTIIPFR